MILATEYVEKCHQTRLYKSFILSSLVPRRVSRGRDKVAQNKPWSFLIFSPSPSVFLGSFSAWFPLRVDVVVSGDASDGELAAPVGSESCFIPLSGARPPLTDALVPLSVCKDKQHLYILVTFRPFVHILPTLIFPVNVLNHLAV